MTKHKNLFESIKGRSRRNYYSHKILECKKDMEKMENYERDYRKRTKS